MIQVFCLGPIEVERGPSAVAAFAFSKDRMEEPVFAATEHECLERMRDLHRGVPLYCEPSLARLGRRLGFEPRPLDDHLLTVRAGLAFNMAIGPAVAASVKPPVVLELIEASAAFIAAEAWTRFDSDSLIHVNVEGAMTGRWEASILGSKGHEFGIGIYLDPGTFARIQAVRDAAAGAALRAQLSTLSLTFDEAPAYAVEAIEARTGVPFVPVPLRVEKGRMRPAEPKHLVVLAACLRAAASDDLAGTAAAANLQARVVIQREAPPPRAISTAQRKSAPARRRR